MKQKVMGKFLAQYLILVTEDDTSLRQVLSHRLEQEGFSVLQARNGEEGLKLAVEKRPHIILLDILMPKMTGLEVMEKLREHGVWGSKIPIILLTNLSPDEEGVMRKVMQDKPTYYLVKSTCDIADIVFKIKARLNIT